MQETWFDPWIGKVPWRRKFTTHSSSLGDAMNRGAWQAIVLGVAKSQTQLSDVLFWFQNSIQDTILYLVVMSVGFSWL